MNKIMGCSCFIFPLKWELSCHFRFRSPTEVTHTIDFPTETNPLNRPNQPRRAQVDGISVFKDFGERNDVYVRGTLTCQPVGRQPSMALLETDVHKYAHKTRGKKMGSG